MLWVASNYTFFLWVDTRIRSDCMQRTAAAVATLWAVWGKLMIRCGKVFLLFLMLRVCGDYFCDVRQERWETCMSVVMRI